MPNENETDAHLDEVTIKQLMWKPGVAQSLAVTILAHMVGRDDRIVFPDEIKTDWIGTESRNIIGTTWRTLAKMGIIKRTSGYRRSVAKNSNGRTIFSYRIESENLARAFLKRNGCPNPDRRGTPTLPGME